MLGQFLKSLRRSRGYSQEKVCDVVGISRQQLYIIEQNPAPFSCDKLKKLASALEYDVEIVFTDRNNRAIVYVYKLESTNNTVLTP